MLVILVQNIWTLWILRLLSWEKHWKLSQQSKSTLKHAMLGIDIVSVICAKNLPIPGYIYTHVYIAYITWNWTQHFLTTLVIDRVIFWRRFCVVAANVSTNKRVIYFTLAEYLVFAGASALQVLYIRNLFSKSVAYNRVWLGFHFP